MIDAGNKTAIVSGISRGIGNAVAQKLLQAGYSVYGNVRVSEDIKTVYQDIPLDLKVNLHISVCDLEDTDAVLDWLNGALAEVYPDVLVNNAAIGILKPLDLISLEEWERVIRVNVTASFLLAQWAFTAMKKAGRGGLIIQIASLASIPMTRKFVGFLPYTASKFAVAGLSENIAVEGGPYGIKSVCLSPGAVNTRLLDQVAPFLTRKIEPSAIAEFIEVIINHFPDMFNGANLPFGYRDSE